MNPKFSVPLVQHTPIIHFQHQQTGASLRATEMKAKLDKFIVAQMGGQEKVYKKHQKTLEKVFTREAGDYKLKISSSLANQYVISASGGNRLRERFNNVSNDIKLLENTAYFADANNIKEGTKNIDNNRSEFEQGNFNRVRLGLSYNNITLHFFCFHEGFESFIKDILPAFFAFYNFGTRQTKGFGCFTTHDTSIEQFRQLLVSAPENLVVYEKECNSSNVSHITKQIQKDYKFLKAGHNVRHQTYEKSLLWRFICNDIDDFPQKNWEKRKIKEILSNHESREIRSVWNALAYEFDHNFSDDHNQRHGLESFYIRALLGLAEHFEFKTQRRNDKVLIKVEDTDTSNENKVERFPSPIIFKVFQNRIFLIARRITPHLYQNQQGQARSFSFTLDANINNNIIEKRLFSLEIPQNFDIVDFLSFALENFEDSPIHNYTQIQ